MKGLWPDVDSMRRAWIKWKGCTSAGLVVWPRPGYRDIRGLGSRVRVGEGVRDQGRGSGMRSGIRLVKGLVGRIRNRP